MDHGHYLVNTAEMLRALKINMQISKIKNCCPSPSREKSNGGPCPNLNYKFCKYDYRVYAKTQCLSPPPSASLK